LSVGDIVDDPATAVHKHGNFFACANENISKAKVDTLTPKATHFSMEKKLTLCEIEDHNTCNCRRAPFQLSYRYNSAGRGFKVTVIMDRVNSTYLSWVSLTILLPEMVTTTRPVQVHVSFMWYLV
jgi:hypothetical protein